MIYAIGDIHGCLDKLTNVYTKILNHIKDQNDIINTIVFMGDYCDRGPDTKGVMDFLMNLKNEDYLTHIFLKGNHENFWQSYCENSSIPPFIWLKNGGWNTVASFCTLSADSPNYFQNLNNFLNEEFLIISKPYMEWIDNLSDIYVLGKYVFAHGKIDSSIPIEEQNIETVLWGRPAKRFVMNSTPKYVGYEDYDKIVIHGHTALEHVYYNDNMFLIDTGCGYSDGKLTAIILPNEFTSADDAQFIDDTLSVVYKRSI